MNKSTDETAAMDRHDEPYKSQLQRIGQAIGYGRAQPAAPADAAPSVAPEPVAWQMIDKHGDTVYVPVTHAIKPDLVLDCDLRHPDNAPHEQRPLFAHPPRAPLTEEQRRDLVKECGLDWQRGYMPLFEGDPTNRYAVLVEAVEAAHGIGGK